MRARIVLGLAAVLLCGSASAAEEGWTPLFNGKDLEGWKNPDPAKFLVEDGCLVGTQTDGKGADLFTKEIWTFCGLKTAYVLFSPGDEGAGVSTSFWPHAPRP